MQHQSPVRQNVLEERPSTPVSALSQAFPPDIHNIADGLPLDLSVAGTPVNNMTPGRPMFVPNSPFVAKRMDTPTNMFPPASVDNRMRARLFGQGMDGGFLVSPMTAGIHSTVKKHVANSSLNMTIPLEPRIYGECNEDPFSEESMHSLGWNRQPMSTPATEDTSMFESGVGLGVCLTNRNGATASCADSPVVISTPSKYPSTLGAGHPLRRRPHLVQHATEPTVFTGNHSETGQGSQPGSQAGTPVQVVHYPAAAPPPVQYVTYIQANVTGASIANVKPPLTLSQVPKRARANRSAMSRSLSMNNAVDISSESAFTNRPLARVPSRNVSTASAPNVAGNDATQSPQLFPVGAGNTIYTRRNLQPPTNAPELVQPLSAPPTLQSYDQQQSRSVSTYSQTSRAALDTPALDYSLPSPAFSTYGHSPWLTTPGLGHDGAIFPSHAFHYQHDQQYSATGLAIQIPPNSQSMGVPVGWQTVHAVQPSGDNTQTQAMHNHEIRIITPGHNDVGQVSQYQYAHPVMYMPPPNVAYLPLPYHPQPSGYWVMNSGAPAESRDVHRAAPSTNPQDSSSARHVSTPFASCSAPEAEVKAESSFTLMTRSVSHGYVPVIAHPPCLHPYSMGPPPTWASTEADLHTNNTHLAATDPAHQGTSKPGVHPLSSIGEETESSQTSNLKQRVRYPAVGKRLRPGPRPKQKRQDDTLLYGAMEDHSTESLERQCPIDSADRVESSLTADGTTRRSTSPLLEVTVAPPVVTRHHPYERVSSLSKEFLESCYTCFMMVEDGAGTAPCKRYRCNIDDCGRIFPRKSAIHSHVQTHLEDKPYVCTEPDW